MHAWHAGDRRWEGEKQNKRETPWHTKSVWRALTSHDREEVRKQTPPWWPVWTCALALRNRLAQARPAGGWSALWVSTSALEWLPWCSQGSQAGWMAMADCLTSGVAETRDSRGLAVNTGKGLCFHTDVLAKQYGVKKNWVWEFAVKHANVTHVWFMNTEGEREREWARHRDRLEDYAPNSWLRLPQEEGRTIWIITGGVLALVKMFGFFIWENSCKYEKLSTSVNSGGWLLRSLHF